MRLAVHGSVQWWAEAEDVAEMIYATSQQLPNPSCSPLDILSFEVFLAGRSLSMHSYSHSTMLSGDMRLLCGGTMPRRRTVQSPLLGFSEGLGEQQIWLATPISCSAQPQPLGQGEDVPPPEAFAGQSAGQADQRWLWAHGEWEVRPDLQRSLPTGISMVLLFIHPRPHPKQMPLQSQP